MYLRRGSIGLSIPAGGDRQGKIYATAEYRITGKDTEIRWYRLVALTQFDDTGKPSSAIGIIFNIDDGCDISRDISSENQFRRNNLNGNKKFPAPLFCCHFQILLLYLLHFYNYYVCEHRVTKF